MTTLIFCSAVIFFTKKSLREGQKNTTGKKVNFLKLYIKRKPSDGPLS